MNKKIVLLTLSVLIALIDFVFILINYHFSHENFEANLKAEAEQNISTLNVAMNQTYSDLLMVASLYAKNPKIQNLFYNGVKSVTAEGGGPGKEQAHYWRQKLFDEIGESWLAASKEFRIRQLHFHIGPGSTSYLRVHRATKYGDNMDNVRHTIVATNETKQPQTGFETGRVYSGLRGVVPMFATNPGTGEKIHTGALEAGTSFSKIIEILDASLGTAYTILLNRDHIEQAMWPEAIKKVFGEVKQNCNCVIEATSRTGVDEILKQVSFDKNFLPELYTPLMVQLGDQTIAATFFPLRDFLGQKYSQRKDIGTVLIWNDATQQLSDLKRQQWVSILYGVFGFIVLELMLFGAFTLVTRRLECLVDQRTRDLHNLNKQLSHEVTVKNRFFSIIAHDLRSPFTTLLGMTRMIERYVDTHDRDQLKKFAGHVNDVGEHFFELLQGLLEWSNDQMNKGSINKTTFNAHDLVDETITSLSYSAREKDVKISNTVDDINIHADSNMIKTVMRNLIANAIKFVNHNGQINICSETNAIHTTIHVTDNGIGLDEYVISKLFRIDEKVSTLGTEGERGTGLGLPLCKEMIERHGGIIEATNIPHGGARFSFTLPHENATEA
ncbi:MAG: ATP-binding protein [Magnetovibrio sp.]|nr:ATP-binding protein [Magnetovibrio sp.]